MTGLQKAIFASGEFTLRLVEAIIALLYLFFLTEYAGLRADVAGAVFWTARIIDAVADPFIGYIGDRTKTRWGRRRPYFLIGAIPFGIFSHCFGSSLPVARQESSFTTLRSMWVLVSQCHWLACPILQSSRI